MSSELPDLSPYVGRRRLGGGEMADVFSAEAPDGSGDVALKVFKPELSAQPVIVEKLLANVRSVVSVRHPNVRTVLGGGKLDDGRPYVAMELLEGRDLASLLDDTLVLDVARMLRVAEQITTGLVVVEEVFEQEVKAKEKRIEDNTRFSFFMIFTLLMMIQIMISVSTVILYPKIKI